MHLIYLFINFPLNFDLHVFQFVEQLFFMNVFRSSGAQFSMNTKSVI